MIQEVGGVSAYLAHMRATGHTACSVVCSTCLPLFGGIPEVSPLGGGLASKSKKVLASEAEGSISTRNDLISKPKASASELESRRDAAGDPGGLKPEDVVDGSIASVQNSTGTIVTGGNGLDCLIARLKSGDFTERRAAAEALGIKKDRRALRPLLEVLMNWKEEEDVVRVVSIALFKSLWADLEQGVQRSILEAVGAGNRTLLSVLMGKIVSVQILGAEDMNAHLNSGQTERVSAMLRHALKEQSVRDLMMT